MPENRELEIGDIFLTKTSFGEEFLALIVLKEEVVLSSENYTYMYRFKYIKGYKPSIDFMRNNSLWCKNAVLISSSKIGKLLYDK